MNLAIINNNQLMFGCDWHNALTGVPPVPVPMMPHVVICSVRGIMFNPEGFDSAFTKKVLSDGELNMALRGYDIGWGVPHIAPNWLIPLIMLGSGSICEWGGFTVEIEGKPPALGFPFVACALNLNCSDAPIPIIGAGVSLNFQLAKSNTIVGFTFGDFLGSAIAIGFDILITGVLIFLGTGLGKSAMKGLGKLGGKYFARALRNNAFIKAASNSFSKISSKASEKLAGSIAKASEKAARKKLVDRIGQRSAKALGEDIIDSWSEAIAEDAGQVASKEITEALQDQFVEQVIVGGGPGVDAPTSVVQAFDIGPDSAANAIADYVNGVDTVK